MLCSKLYFYPMKASFEGKQVLFNRKFTYRVISWAAKIAIFLALGYLLSRHLNDEKGIAYLWESLKSSLVYNNLYLIFIAIALIPCNWILESYKWQILTTPYDRQNFRFSIYSILCGITLAIITPNRVGEYGGRILFLKPEHKARGLVSNFISSISQNSMNICFGFICAILFYDVVFGLNPWARSSLIFLWFVVTICILFIYFNIDILRRVLKRFRSISLVEKLFTHIEFVKTFSNHDLTRVLGFSFLRFFIYLSQYILILSFFGIDQPLGIMVLGVATIYLVQTGIPLPPLLGILARGEIAILVWGLFHYNELSILAATYSLWILNLVIPALIGLILLMKTNLLKSFGFER